ncbi:MAG TPA: hypothetical protein VGK19_18860 [Capsulimonadaceae bacterium]|jgi:agarase
MPLRRATELLIMNVTLKFISSYLAFGTAMAASLCSPLVADFGTGTGTPAGWAFTGFGFATNRGGLECFAMDDKAFATWKAAPKGRDVTVDATVNAGATTGRRWSSAGVGVIDTGDNYWQLALVEAPASLGGKRFVELAEMHDGQWLAQSQPGTKLTTVSNTGGFAWKSGTAYRLRLVIRPATITGEVREGDALVYRCVLRVDAPAVSQGRPMAVAAGVAVRYTDFSADVAETVNDDSVAPIPPFAWTTDGLPGGKATGYFHVETIKGVSWLVDPAGRLCFSTGVDYVTYGGMRSATLGYSPYARVAAAKYGGQEAWSTTQLERLHGWGFNVLGAGCSSSLERRGMAHTRPLGLGAGFNSAADIIPRTAGSGFPDVFDSRFAAYCDSRASELCGASKSDPWLMGYFLDNELDWYGVPSAQSSVGLAYASWRHGPNAPCKQAFTTLAERVYASDIAAFNRDFGTTYHSFAELLSGVAPGMAKGQKAAGLLDAFCAQAADRYFDITSAAVRKHDPNHMILGCRFSRRAPDAAWKAAGRNCDIVTINIYAHINIDSETAPQVTDVLAGGYALCRRPIVVTEWSFPARDAVDSMGVPIPSVHGAGMRVDTQTQRAACFRIMQSALASTPFVVGSHYFMYGDEPATGCSPSFPEDSNYGLVSESDVPYREVTAAAKQANSSIVAVHAGRCADISASTVGKTIIVKNSGSIAATVPVAVWINGKRSDRSITLAPGVSWTLPLPAQLVKAAAGVYVHVECDPARTVPQGSGANLSADLVLPAAGHSVTVWNPSATALAAATAQLPSGESVRTGSLPPYGVRVVASPEAVTARRVPPGVKLERNGPCGYKIDNGIIRLTKDPSTGALVDAVGLAESGASVTVGSYWPLINVVTAKGDDWIKGDKIVSVRVVSQDANRIVLDITASHASSDTPNFSCAYRLEIRADESFFRSRILWIKNDGTEDLVCRRYYQYPLPSFKALPEPGTIVDDWTAAGVWRSAEGGLQYGLTPAIDDGKLSVGFWNDRDGGFHPDCARIIDATIKPGQQWDPRVAEPTVLVGGQRSSSPTTTFRSRVREMRAQFAVSAVTAAGREPQTMKVQK